MVSNSNKTNTSHIITSASSTNDKNYLNDIVIVSAVRTAITRAKGGGFEKVEPELLLSSCLSSVCKKAGIPTSLVDDIQVGNVLAPGGGAIIARMAMFHAGFPEQTTISTCNRQCSSGLQAVASIAASIRGGFIQVGIGAGMESMSLHYGIPGSLPQSIHPLVAENERSAQCLTPMGITSECVASEFGIGRKEQDEFALGSHRKALKAMEQGLFLEEIVPVTIPNNNSLENKTICRDDGIRPSTSLDSLGSLKPAFKTGGTTTPGNSSQVSDGAAAVLLMTRALALKLKIQPLAKFVDYVVAGVPPLIMGIGPAVAIPKLLERNKLSVEDVDLYEINEAFASQAVYCQKVLKIPTCKLNVKGGAIAIGHPLGCTGARQIATLLPEMKRRSARYGIVSMCIGSGMGAAALLEREEAPVPKL